jgi:hypothetical protein
VETTQQTAVMHSSLAAFAFYPRRFHLAFMIYFHVHVHPMYTSEAFLPWNLVNAGELKNLLNVATLSSPVMPQSRHATVALA